MNLLERKRLTAAELLITFQRCPDPGRTPQTISLDAHRVVDAIAAYTLQILADTQRRAAETPTPHP